MASSLTVNLQINTIRMQPCNTTLKGCPPPTLPAMVYLAPLFSPLKIILISTAPILQEVEPVGRWFEAYVSRNRKNISLSNSEPDEHSEENDKDNKESSSSSSDSEDERYLLTLDPKEWKVITSAIVI